MYENQVFDSAVRYPRAIILVNGVRVAWLDWEANKNSYYQADTFRVVLPVKGQPPEITRTWWASQSPLVVEIYAGFPADPSNYDQNSPGMKLIIMGEADELPTRMVAGTIVLVGRDYTAFMIDEKLIVEERLNSTASDVVTSIAEKYNFGTKFITKTKTTIGVLYKMSFTEMRREITEWDFLCFLAQSEGFEIYMDGTDLHFEPKPETAPVVMIQWWDEDEHGSKRFFGKELTFVRNLTLAKDIVVYFRVYDIKTKKPFTVKREATHNRDKVLNRGKRYYTKPQIVFQHRKEFMDKAHAVAEAQALLENLSRHQVKMFIEGMPANLDITPQVLLQVTGTLDYDQTYHPDSILHRFSVTSGYVMDIIAKNHDTDTQIPVL